MQTPSRFFGGDGSNMGRVSQLAPTSWAKFVQELLGHPVLVNTTRAQFHALPKKERVAIKRVAYVTPAAFATSPAQRLYENARSISFVALDIDDSAQARPFAADPQRLRAALDPLAFAVYHTASSTPAEPKLRVFVAANDLPHPLYSRAARYVARLLGLTTITSESRVSVQPMYLPTMFRDDDPIEQHPLIVAVTEGDAVSVAMLDEDQDNAVGVATKSTAQHLEANLDELDYLRPTVEGVTLEDCENALEHLDPDCTYPEWLEVAAALRHQFPQESDAAYHLFDTWSHKGKKYAGGEDTAAKWKSLRASPRGRAPVTARTLLNRAATAGWSPTTVAAKCYGALLEWLSDDSRTSHELMAQGVKRIAGAPLQSAVERGTLLSRLRDALGKHKLKATTSELKKELARVERSGHKKEQEMRATPENQLPVWARGMCYVGGTDEFYQRHADRRMSPAVVDSRYGRYLMDGQSSESGRPPMRPQDFLLNVVKVPTVDHYLYDPAHPESAFLTEGKQHFVNLYLPTYPEPDPEDADYAGMILHEHLTNLIGESDYRRRLLDYMAHIVQEPGVKIRWAVLLQGTQGCGKTALAELLRAVLGNTNVTIMDASMLFSQFNTWAYGAQVVAIEEIRIVGHNRHDVMNKLKPCISNDTVTINGKRKDLRINVPNHANYFMFTNHQDSLAVADDDRRHFVLNSRLQNKDQVLALGPDYFPALFNCIGVHAAGLRAFLEAHKISRDFNPSGHAPVTTYLKELATAAATPLSAAIAEAIADGDHPLVQRDLVSTKALKAMMDMDHLPRFTDQQMGVALREMDYVACGRLRLDDGRHYMWTRRDGDIEIENVQGEAEKRLKTGGFEALL